MIGALVLIVYGGEQTAAPLSVLDIVPVSLDPTNLPAYALRTTMRMLLAIVCSIIFTFIYAALAAKSPRAEMVLIPLLDILQSVPILGFLTFTVVFFMNLFPGRVFGAELACVFAIFTSQAWNMTLSMHQTMRNVSKDLDEASRSFHLSGWQRFWRLDVPFAMPGLIWNTMMSMSGGCFFVVASEAITVGDTTMTLLGIGSYVALAIKEQNLPAIGYAILAMFLVILAYDQLLFRPVVAWADKFRFEQTASATEPSSWMLDLFRRTRALRALSYPFTALNRAVSNLHIALPKNLRVAAWLGEGIAAHEIGLFVRTPELIIRARAAIDGLTGATKMVTAKMSLARGLEFREVLVMACEQGALPLDERVADEAKLHDIYETERRLFYVA